MELKTFGFIGFGLIAGSMAKAIKSAYKDCTIVVTSRSFEPLLAAKNDGTVDIVTSTVDNNFSKCDIIFICTPVMTINKYLADLKDIVKKDCIITDVGSVKTSVHEVAKKLEMQNVFIGGHPMAGSQLSGYANSNADILKGATYIITPTEYTDQNKLDSYIDLVNKLHAIPLIMDYIQHDKVAAQISHIPHLLSSELVHLVKNEDTGAGFQQKMAAGGFRDTSRIAASSPEMWAQICDSNAEPISDLLAKYISQLSELKKNIDEHNTDYIKNLFYESGQYRKTFYENV